MAIPSIINVIIISGLFFLIFGIVGVNYLKGMYYSCSIEQETTFQLINKWDCLNAGGEWVNFLSNFDNILQAIFTLFHMSTTVGWAEVMYKGCASTGVDKVPIERNNMYLAFFFLLFIIIGSFFILNLFVGVVISTYNREKEKLGKNFLLTEGQKQWLQTKMVAYRAMPKVYLARPRNKMRRCFYTIAEYRHFETFILTCIILNTVALTLKWPN